MAPDFETWHAMHADCPPEGCGGCTTFDVEVQPDTLRSWKIAAQLMGQSLQEFLHSALYAAVRKTPTGLAE